MRIWGLIFFFQVFSPAKVIFAGIGILPLASISLDSSVRVIVMTWFVRRQRMLMRVKMRLVDLFSRIENFFKRLELYTEVSPTPTMTSIITNIMVEVLIILGIATKEMKQRRLSESIDIYESFLTYISLGKFLKKILGKNDIEDALKRLDTLTQEEARMATAEILKVTRCVRDQVAVLVDGAQDSFSPSNLYIPDNGLIRRQQR